MRFPGPTLLRQSLQRAIELHPYAASGRIGRSARADSDSSAVWDRLLTRVNGELDDAILALTPHELGLVRYSARARLADADSIDILRRVLELRHPPNMASIAWDAFLVTERGDRVFREAAESHVAMHADIRAWMFLLKSSSPVQDAGGVYLASKTKELDEWLAAEDVRLDRRPIFKRLLKRHLLRPETVLRVITRLGITVVDEWLEATYDGIERVAWFQNYLTTTAAVGWRLDDPILRRIIDRFKTPDQHRRFWEGVSSEVIYAVELWLRNAELTRLLGEGERVEFWRRFLPHIQRSIATQTGDAVFICGDGWLAVQFVAMGRATYMFRSVYLAKMRWCDGNRLYHEVLNTKSLGAYEHRGYYWQDKAELEVNRVIREYSE